jgi:hypothetical protein
MKKDTVLKNVVEDSSIRYFKDNTQYLVDAEHAYKAMELYAKQQAISFAGFINSKFDPHGDNYVSKISSDNVVYFKEELYNQFIEQQNKQK